MNKAQFLKEIAKGCQKKDSTEGGLSFFTVDQRPPALETNRYKSGYIVPHFSELAFVDEDTLKWVKKITETLDYDYAALLFSETHLKKGVLPHIHIPFTDLPTVTFSKVFYKDKDPAFFNFYERVDPTGTVAVNPSTLKNKKAISCEEDGVFVFDSSRTPHEVEVSTDTTSITGFFFFEKVKNIQDVMREFSNIHDMR